MDYASIYNVYYSKALGTTPQFTQKTNGVQWSVSTIGYDFNTETYFPAESNFCSNIKQAKSELAQAMLYKIFGKIPKMSDLSDVTIRTKPVETLVVNGLYDRSKIDSVKLRAKQYLENNRIDDAVLISILKEIQEI